jgi:hypothetical protein
MGRFPPLSMTPSCHTNVILQLLLYLKHQHTQNATPKHSTYESQRACFAWPSSGFFYAVSIPVPLHTFHVQQGCAIEYEQPWFSGIKWVSPRHGHLGAQPTTRTRSCSFSLSDAGLSPDESRAYSIVYLCRATKPILQTLHHVRTWLISTSSTKS